MYYVSRVLCIQSVCIKIICTMYLECYVSRLYAGVWKYWATCRTFQPIFITLVFPIYFVYSLVSIYWTFTRFIGQCPAWLAVSTPLDCMYRDCMYYVSRVYVSRLYVVCTCTTCTCMYSECMYPECMYRDCMYIYYMHMYDSRVYVLRLYVHILHAHVCIQSVCIETECTYTTCTCMYPECVSCIETV